MFTPNAHIHPCLNFVDLALTLGTFSTKQLAEAKLEKNRGPKKGKLGRTLTEKDLTYCQKILSAINETIRIMVEIDDVISAHGGWPDTLITADSQRSKK